MAKPALVVVQSFLYRGQPEEWSNKYHFSGSAPGDSASWLALADAVIAAKRPTQTSETTFVRAYGYNDGDNPSVWSHDYTVPGPPLAGSLSTVGLGPQCPGDSAAWIRWPTAKRNSKGKIVYARKYFHGVHQQDVSLIDVLATNQSTAMLTFATKCIDGTISAVFHLCLPDGTACETPIVSYWLTTRTLKRRGKRPPT